jgi:Protein of unknown function (DUF3307)
MTALEIFAWLLIGHALADYPLQGEWIARAKQPGFTVDGEVIWPGVLACHAAIHAGAVKLVTGSWLLAGLEFVAHAAIDYTKGRGWLSYNGDQAVHVACKVVWAALCLIIPGT